jgi:hypothetical protein
MYILHVGTYADLYFIFLKNILINHLFLKNFNTKIKKYNKIFI